MTLDFSLLDPKFSSLAQQLVQDMTDKGYGMIPYYGLRTLEAQAKLYRQSRSTALIATAIKMLKDNECDYLANIMESVGPQPRGPWSTNALPGESYHNWGLAMDCLIADDRSDDYKIYANHALELGLTAGYYFRSVDMGHVQLGSSSLPHGYNIKQINDHFVTISTD